MPDRRIVYPVQQFWGYLGLFSLAMAVVMLVRVHILAGNRFAAAFFVYTHALDSHSAYHNDVFARAQCGLWFDRWCSDCLRPCTLAGW